jgi:hypothetical protein|tara:strand:+ start:92 stop:301 length:210 start_codon:yes stop_codon:yes gene_type:complete
MPQPIMTIAALAVITIALIGQAREMRKIRMGTYGEDSIGHPNIFLDKRNFKWYALIAIGFGLAYTAQFL